MRYMSSQKQKQKMSSHEKYILEGTKTSCFLFGLCSRLWFILSNLHPSLEDIPQCIPQNLLQILKISVVILHFPPCISTREMLHLFSASAICLLQLTPEVCGVYRQDTFVPLKYCKEFGGGSVSVTEKYFLKPMLKGPDFSRETHFSCLLLNWFWKQNCRTVRVGKYHL